MFDTRNLADVPFGEVLVKCSGIHKHCGGGRMVGGCEEKKKKWLGLYVSTTQNRQDNLLSYIVVTRAVFHFETSELKDVS